jgi:hypothetical protein
MSTVPPKLVTVGVIAAELGVSVDRVARILRARPHIQPKAYAGNIRLFDNETVSQVRYEMNTINARRGMRGGQHA